MRFRIDGLPAKQIKAALALDMDRLPDDESSAIRDFIERIGGRENAELAVEVLEEIEGPKGGLRRKHGQTE